MTKPTREQLGHMSVNDTIARFPDTLSVFDAFGIDACCGGAASVREAACRDGADPEALVMALLGIAAASIEVEGAGQP